MPGAPGRPDSGYLNLGVGRIGKPRPICYTGRHVRFNLSLRIAALGFMFTTAIVGGLGLHFFATTWSNHCDPGNTQFYVLKNDPIVSYRAEGELYTWISDKPDNGWLCGDPHLSVFHVGPDVKRIWNATTADMARHGWSNHPSIYIKDQTFDVYEKTTSGGVRLSADISQELFSVEVYLTTRGLHFGEYGF